ncbi:MAG: hypothetical protein M3323_10915 [Actinomycetota bacterium]|nr:hypothetical protein [Actinomycetota bacterium]
MKKRYIAVLAVVAVTAGLMFAAPAVIAHGTCAPEAQTPVKDQTSITALAKIVCTDQHAKYNIYVALQKQQTDGSWNTVLGPELDTTFDTKVGTSSESKSCVSGTYRSRMTSGIVYNSSNQQVHPGSGEYTDSSPTNSISC